MIIFHILDILFSRYFTTLTNRITENAPACVFPRARNQKYILTALGNMGIRICMHKQRFGTMNFRFKRKRGDALK